SDGHAEPSEVPPMVHEVLNSPGQSLDAGTRAFFEPRFGHDFSRVRVHTDAKAAESAQAVNAAAYTVGRDVVFGNSQYTPQTGTGQRLLAHELTHVIQQEQVSGLQRSTLRLGAPDDTFERQADAAADRISQSRPVPPIADLNQLAVQCDLARPPIG